MVLYKANAVLRLAKNGNFHENAHPYLTLSSRTSY